VTAVLNESRQASGRAGDASPRSPLWATAALTWVNNLGASAALIGVYFVAEHAHHFTAGRLLALGLLQGSLYIASSLLAGPFTRRFAGPTRALSTRALLALVHVALFASALLPILWQAPAAMWLVVALYATLSGVIWPTLESFLSAGRTGDDLRRSSAAFNLSWASCQVVTFMLLALFMDEARPHFALWAIPVMGISHLAAIPLIAFFQREPAAHGEASHLHDPAEADRFRRLLDAHRLLLILSYVAFSSLNPLLPSIISDRLHVDARWSTPLTAVWMVSRVGMFWFMGAWSAWHGRSATLAWPAALLVTGLALAMLAPTALLLAIGLALFGLGMGAAYSAAFYYAMEVGSAGVDAGGKHEAFIGMGYSVGPLLGTAASLTVATPDRLPHLTLAFVAVPAIAAGIYVIQVLRRAPASAPSRE
jgi:hypothetical protein